jgi:phospholipase/carboxylesterase
MGRRVAPLVALGLALARFAAPGDLGYYAEARMLCPVIVRESSHGGKAPPPLVVALHGRGGNASEFANLWAAFAEPRPIVAAPQAPYPLLIAGEKPALGFSWFVLSNDKNLWRQADPFSVEYVLGVVRDLKKDRVVSSVYLLGFSQGVACAYMTALQQPELFDGVVAFAGELPTGEVPDETIRKAAGAFRVFIAHGRGDATVKPEESLRAKKTLEGMGYSVTYREFAGGHQLSAEVLREAQEWMAAKGSSKQ